MKVYMDLVEVEGDVFDVTAEWLDSWQDGYVVLADPDDSRLFSTFGTVYGLSPDAANSGGNLIISTGQGYGSQLITGVHEVGHMRGVTHGPTMRQIEFEAYQGLTPAFRSTAGRQYDNLRQWGFHNQGLIRP